MPVSPWSSTGKGGRRQALDHAQHVADHRAVTDDLQRQILALHGIGDGRGLGIDGDALGQGLDLGQQPAQVHRFFQKIVRPEPHHPHRGVHAAVGRNHDGPHHGVDFLDARQDRVAVHVGHAVVEQHQGHRPFGHLRQGLLSAGRGDRGVALLGQKTGQYLALQRFVIDDENLHLSFLTLIKSSEKNTKAQRPPR